MSEALNLSYPQDFAPRLVAWQRQHGRSTLPWQNTRDPYRVWLSEIMLQQTQVTTVLGYYARFLERFPSVVNLADAHLDEVLSMWQGLGYYSRARNLHRCAQAVRDQHGGTFPQTAAALQDLPGIGRSTAAAIAAFCFGQRVAILDGNVKRVLGRVLAFEGDLSSSAQEKKLWAMAEELVPDKGVESYTQGLMDLGATVCTPKNPACAICPMNDLCRGRAEPLRYPVKTKKLKRGRRENWWLWLERDGCVLLQQRPDKGVWAGLWSLPMFDEEGALRAGAGGDAAVLEVMPRIEHALTHFDWVIHTRRVQNPVAGAGLPEGQWVAREELARYALPAPLKKLINP